MKSKNNIKILVFVMLVSLVMTGCTKNNNTIQTTDSTSTVQTVSNNNVDKNASELEKIILEGNKRYYTEGEIQNKSSYELSLLRNGLFALSGKTFVENQEVKAFFENCDWYSPDTEDSNIVKSRFNEYQNANLDLIISIENEKITPNIDGELPYSEQTYHENNDNAILEQNYNYDEHSDNNSYEEECSDVQDNYEEENYDMHTYFYIDTTQATTTTKATTTTTKKPAVAKKSKILNGVKIQYQTKYYDNKGGIITFSKFNIVDPGEGYGYYRVEVVADISKAKSATIRYNAYDRNGNIINKHSNALLGTLRGSPVKDSWTLFTQWEKDITRIEIFLHSMTY